MRSLLLCLAVAASLSVSMPAGAAGVTEDSFMVRNTGDLVTLCTADKADPMYTAAQNFCHGFAVATYRAINDVQRGMRSKRKLFCETVKPANRNEAIGAFVAWAQSHNDMMALPATDGILKFLEQQYSCS